MKKIVFALVLLAGCKGKFVWMPSDKVEKTEIIVPKLKTDLGGVKITLDDGPDLARTPKVLDMLKKYNLQATFFVEGINLVGESEQAQERRELLKKMYGEGHIIGNHTFDHAILTLLTEQKIMWEIDRTTQAIEEITGAKVELIRLPYGKNNKKVNDILIKRHLKSVKWDIDTMEWKRNNDHTLKTKEQVLAEFIEQYEKLQQQGQKNSILLLHDTKNITIETLPLILDYLSKK